ncbi:hypothetical protein ACFRFJ_07455 [Streptomyces hydrogenans]|uniref:hypothetical protein n=1 Tax=Streptomyces hydrogenans TaxID=1873719 RepID=UPI00363AF84A
MAMRIFSAQGSKYAALIILGDHEEFDAMEVVEWTNEAPGKMILEFRMDDTSARLSYIHSEVDISLLRVALEIFREEFFEPRWKSGTPCPPW